MREIGSPVQAELVADTLTPIGLVELLFDSGALRLWTGIGDFIWGDEAAFTDGTSFSDETGFTDAVSGTTWTGVGTLGRIGSIEETTDLRAVGLEMVLSGIPTEVLAIALGEEWQGRSAKVYYAVVDSQRQLIGEPFVIFDGIMDQMMLVEGETASITLACESALIDLERTKARRYTPEDQKAEYPGDTFFDRVADLQELDIKWGRG